MPGPSPTHSVQTTLSPLRQAAQLGILFAALKLVLHIGLTLWQRHLGYGYFRDEFYYIACGRHLAWGYVDHGPIVALQARLAETLFGDSLLGIRLLTFLGGAIRVALTGLLCWSLGGRRSAQALAMLFVLIAPIYLGIDSILNMNSWESAFWMACLLPLILLLRGGNPRLWWTVFGISAGLGVLNKPSIAFFFVALAAGLLLSPERRILFTRWAALGISLAAVIMLPYLAWQMHHGWATLVFLHNGQAGHKNTRLRPLPFMLNQVAILGGVSVAVWAAGLVHLLRRSGRRWIGITYFVFLGIMIAMGAKDYYVTPIYPVLFAAGGVAWQQHFANRSAVAQDRLIAWPILSGLAVVLALVVLPTTNPVLRPATFQAYVRALHLPSTDTENQHHAELPQFFADRFGWQELTNEVTAISNRLPPDQRVRTGIFCSNYGEAGALEFLGHGLPPVISEHNNYWLWGTKGLDGEEMIIVANTTSAKLHEHYRDVQQVGYFDHPLAMPYERHKPIYLVRGRKDSLSKDWAASQDYF